MKKMLKQILLLMMILIKMMVIILISLVLFKNLNQLFKNPKADYGLAFKTLKPNSLDVVVLGSSHAQYSTIPSMIYRKTKLATFNMGSQCQPLNVSYEFLKEVLKTQKPQLVMLEIYTALPSKKSCEADSNYIVAQYQMSGQEKQNVLNMLKEDKALSYRQEFLNNHNNWRSLNHFSDLFKVDDYLKDSSFGYVYNDILAYENYWKVENKAKQSEQDLKVSDLKALNDIKALLDKQNIELLLYHIPMQMDDLDQDVKYRILKWANDHQVKVLDFFDAKYNDDFKVMVHGDTHHSNIIGANYLSTKIAEFIDANYKLKASIIDEKLKGLYLQNSNQLLEHIVDKELNPNFIFNTLKDFDSLIIVKYVKDHPLNDDSLKVLKQLGLSFDPVKNYFAIIKDKQVLAFDENYLEYNFNDKKIIVDEKGILVNGESKNIAKEIFINQEVNTESNFSMVIYGENNSFEIVKNFKVRSDGSIWTQGFDEYVVEGYW